MKDFIIYFVISFISIIFGFIIGRTTISPYNDDQNDDVVHCKDCDSYIEYDQYDRDSDEDIKCHYCVINKRDPGETGFCSSGVRKDLQ